MKMRCVSFMSVYCLVAKKKIKYNALYKVRFNALYTLLGTFN